jgi:glycosyltransferase involved in cell wall biosynthesis
MKITFFSPSLAGGGAQRVTANLVNALSDQDLQVELLLAEKTGPYKELISPNVPLINLNSSRVLWSFPRLVKYVKNYKPDVLVSVQAHTNIVAIWAKLVLSSKTKVVITEHNTPTVNLSRSHLKRDQWILRMIPWFYRFSDSIIAVSKGVADDLSSLVRSREISIIYNPIFRTELMERSREQVNHPWFKSSEYPLILSAGRLTKQKNYENLIQAFKEVRNYINAKLVILGEGEKRLCLEALIQKLGIEHDVCLPGFVKNPYAYMSRADIFVLSSRWEGFGNVLVEAMACGAPVVSTDCPSGPAEILDNGRYGRLVPVGDPDTMARAILETLKDPPDTKASVERAKKFSIEASTKQYLDLFKKLVGE